MLDRSPLLLISLCLVVRTDATRTVLALLLRRPNHHACQNMSLCILVGGSVVRIGAVLPLLAVHKVVSEVESVVDITKAKLNKVVL
jgi:hypothetical protein